MTSRYTIGKELGRGSFGITYLGTDSQMGKNVAIKVIDINKSTQLGVDKNMIMDELRTMQELSSAEDGCHPNIACYYDSFEEIINGNPSVVAISEYVDGGDLRNYTIEMQKRGTPPNPEQLWGMMEDIVTALDYMHAKGFAHRDIKTDNIMIDASTGRLKIIDFGVSCTKSCGPGAGTIIYMPVESLDRSAPRTLKASQAHDIFSAGMVFYELANLGMPFNINISNDESIKSLKEDPLTKTNPNNYNVDAPWRKSQYNLAAPNSRISNETFNAIIRMMLDRNWATRPTARQLIQYMGEEMNGCTIGGTNYNREQVYSELNRIGARFDIDPGYIYLNSLCQILGNSETKNYSVSNIAPTYYNR